MPGSHEPQHPHSRTGQLGPEPTSPPDRKHDCYAGVPRRIGGQRRRCAQIAATCGSDDSPTPTPTLGEGENWLSRGSGGRPLRKRGSVSAFS
jgi:hypothetical protein